MQTRKTSGHSVGTGDSPRNLDYTENIGLQSSKHQDAKQKAEPLSETASNIAFKVNTKKT